MAFYPDRELVTNTKFANYQARCFVGIIGVALNYELKPLDLPFTLFYKSFPLLHLHIYKLSLSFCAILAPCLPLCLDAANQRGKGIQTDSNETVHSFHYPIESKTFQTPDSSNLHKKISKDPLDFPNPFRSNPITFDQLTNKSSARLNQNGYKLKSYLTSSPEKAKSEPSRDYDNGFYSDSSDSTPTGNEARTLKNSPIASRENFEESKRLTDHIRKIQQETERMEKYLELHKHDSSIKEKTLPSSDRIWKPSEKERWLNERNLANRYKANSPNATHLLENYNSSFTASEKQLKQPLFGSSRSLKDHVSVKGALSGTNKSQGKQKAFVNGFKENSDGLELLRNSEGYGKNPLKEMSRNSSSIGKPENLNAPLRKRHQSMPDYIQNKTNLDFEHLPSNLYGKPELSQALSASKNPIQDLISALREDVEKLAEFRAKRKLHVLKKPELTSIVPVKPDSFSRLSRSQSFGAIEHNYQNKEGELPPKVLPRSSSKEAIHRLAKLHRIGSSSTPERRLLDISFKSEGDVFLPSPDKNSDDENHPDLQRPAPPKNYVHPLQRNRGISEPSLNRELSVLNSSFKRGFEIEPRNESHVTNGPTVDSNLRRNDSDLEVEYRNSSHSSLSGLSSTSLLPSPVSNISANSSLKSSSNQEASGNNFGKPANIPQDLLENRITSFYEGDSESMSWLAKKFDFLHSRNQVRGSSRQKDPATGHIRSDSQDLDAFYSLPHSSQNQGSIPKSQSFHSGDRQTSSTNWTFKKFAKTERLENPTASVPETETSVGGVVYEFVPTQSFVDELRETDILGSSTEEFATAGSEQAKKDTGRDRVNDLHSVLNRDHSQYVETLKNLAPIWLVNPGAHPKSKPGQGTRQRSLSTSATISNVLDREDLWKSSSHSFKHSGFILPLDSPRAESANKQEVPRKAEGTTLRNFSPVDRSENRFEQHPDREKITPAYTRKTAREPPQTTKSPLSSEPPLFPDNTPGLIHPLSSRPDKTQTHQSKPWSFFEPITTRESSDVTMKLSSRSKSKGRSGKEAFPSNDELDMGSALAELDAAVNSLQDLVLTPPPTMKSFGKTTESSNTTPTHQGLSSFSPSTRISTNYPQFPSSWNEPRRPFSPERDNRSSSNSGKSGSLANALSELTAKRGQLGGRSGDPISVTVPSRSRSFKRGIRPENFADITSYKRSGSEEPSVPSPNSGPAQFDNMPFPSAQFGYPRSDSGWSNGPSKLQGRDLKELSIDTQSITSVDSDFRFRSNTSVRSDADYTNNTLPHPHPNSSMRAVNMNYHNVSGNFVDSKLMTGHFVPISPIYTDDFYSIPSATDVLTNLAASCEQTSKLWYRPKMTRDDITAALCRQPVGSFIIRDSTSYPGYYGLAIKTDMSGVNGTSMAAGSDSIRHFLIETSVRGARIKGSPAEPHFKSLADLVESHVRSPISLPCKLVLPPLPSKPVSHPSESSSQKNQSNESRNNTIGRTKNAFPLAQKSPNHVAVTIPAVQITSLSFDELDNKDAVDKVKQRSPLAEQPPTSPNFKDRTNSNSSLNSQHTTSSVNTTATSTNGSQISAACMVLYLGCYDVELLSGSSAVNRAMFCLIEDERRQFSPSNYPKGVNNMQQPFLLQSEPSPVHFRMDQKSVTVTDMSRKVFFRKCISLQALLYCGIPASANWGSVRVKSGGREQVKKVFGLVTKKEGQMSSNTNQCWLFAEYEDDQPASAIINFARKLTTSFSPLSGNFIFS